MNGENKTPYDIIGGASSVQTLVRRFYDIMDTNPAYAALREMHAPDLGATRTALTGFLTGWLGGPRDWLEKRGGFCIMSRHASMGITAETAGQWLCAMREAMDEVVTDTALYTKMDEAFTKLTQAMSWTPEAT